VETYLCNGVYGAANALERDEIKKRTNSILRQLLEKPFFFLTNNFGEFMKYFYLCLLCSISVHASERDFKNEYNDYGRPINQTIQFPEGESDRAISEAVRIALDKASGLSDRARHVAIYTHDGRVTLRGHVDSYDERSRVVSIVTLVNNVKNVDNKIEVIGG
jgi:hypothetical protein